MKADTPEDVIEQFTVALNGGNVDGAMELYEPAATLAPPTRRGGNGPRGNPGRTRRVRRAGSRECEARSPRS